MNRQSFGFEREVESTLNRDFRNKYRESEAHLELKERAIYWLRDRGYSTSTETQICIEGKIYRVDVVGFKDGESIAIECGRTKHSKIEDLKKVFTEVKRFYYTSRINPKTYHNINRNRKETKPIPIKGTVIGVRTIKNRGRIQVPKTIRDALNFDTGDKICWIKGLDGRFYIAKAVELR